MSIMCQKEEYMQHHLLKMINQLLYIKLLLPILFSRLTRFIMIHPIHLIHHKKKSFLKYLPDNPSRVIL
jgi:hypothetical protein